MEPTVHRIEEWLDEYRHAADDFAAGSLRFDGCPAPALKDSPLALPGAYIAILGERHSLHLGLCAAPHQVHALARGLLGLRQDEPLDDREAADGVSEVMNILAGKVKSKMTVREGRLQLGLPMFIATPIQPSPAHETAAADVHMGPVACRLLVYRRALAA